MADVTKNLKIALSLANPQLLTQLQSLVSGTKTVQFQVKGNFDKGFEKLTTLTEKSITINISSSNALAEIQKVRKALEDLQNLKPIEIKGSSVAGRLRSVKEQEFKALADALGPGVSSGIFTKVTGRKFNNNLVGTSGQELDNTLKELRAFKATKDFAQTANIARKQQSFFENSDHRKALRDQFVEDLKIGRRAEVVFSKGGAAEVLNKRGGEFNFSEREKQDILGRTKAGSKVFDFNRIRSPETAQQLLFAGLFGGPTSLIGGAIGGAALGPVGAFGGSVIGQAVGDLFGKLFETIKTGLEGLIEAGKTFESSVLSIQSILQVNTRLFGPDGKQLSTKEQIRLNRREAENIQLTARGRLSQLGIGGQSESTLVRGIVAGLGQRGLSGNAEQVTQIAERFGAAILANQPELLDNPGRLSKDLEDILGGGPRAGSTTLSQFVKSALPGIVNATSAEDVVKATNALQQYIESIRGSTDSFITQSRRVQGITDTALSRAGAAFDKTITPAISKFADAISNPAFESGLENIATVLGDIANYLITVTAEGIDFLDYLKDLTSFLRDEQGKVPKESNKKSKTRSAIEEDLNNEGNPEIAGRLNLLGLQSLSDSLPQGKRSIKDLFSDVSKKPVNRKPSDVNALSQLLAPLGIGQEDLAGITREVKNTPERRTNLLRSALNLARGSSDLADSLPGLERLNKRDEIESVLRKTDAFTISGQRTAALQQTKGELLERRISGGVASAQNRRTEEDFNLKTTDATIQLLTAQKQLADSIFNTNQRFKELDDTLIKNKQTQEDIRKDTRLRDLGALGDLISARQDAIKKGNPVSRFQNFTDQKGLQRIIDVTNEEDLRKVEQDVSFERLARLQGDEFFGPGAKFRRLNEGQPAGTASLARRQADTASQTLGAENQQANTIKEARDLEFQQMIARTQTASQVIRIGQQFGDAASPDLLRKVEESKKYLATLTDPTKPGSSEALEKMLGMKGNIGSSLSAGLDNNPIASSSKDITDKLNSILSAMSSLTVKLAGESVEALGNKVAASLGQELLKVVRK